MEKELNTYISRILSGYYIFVCKNTMYKLKYPDLNTKYLAELYAQEEFDQNRFNDWISDEEIVNYLIVSDLWNPVIEKEFNSLSKTIEDYKVNLYENEFNKVKQKKIRKSLSDAKLRLDHLHTIRHSFDHLTVTGYANLLKSNYILAHSIFDMQDNLIFPNIEDIDFVLFNNLSSSIAQGIISSAAFREIARSDIWRNYWISNKNFVFGKPTIEWTDEQRNLAVITKMYDNAYEHPECPDNHIIEDDDMFDGWMISIRRDNEKQKKNKQSEKRLGDKLSNSGEVFLMANSRDEAKEIYDLNNVSSRNIIKERQSLLNKSKGPIKDSELPDVNRNLQMQQVQQIKQQSKRK